LAGRGDGFVHLPSTSFGYLGDYGTIGRIHVGEFARATHKTAVNVILQEFHGVIRTSERISRDTAQRLRSY
jgi:hypothetical protein